MSTEGDGYKKVQIGPKTIRIPREWTKVPLKEISKDGKKTFIDGDWVESKDMVNDGDYQLIQLGNLEVGNFKGECDKFISEDFFQENNCTLVEEGDLLISRMAYPILRTIVVPGFEKKSITAVDIVVAKIDSIEWSKRYVKNILNYKIWTNVGEAYATGSTRLRISRSNLEKIGIPKPPLPEQKKIAEVLSTVDDAIQKTDEIIERAKELKKGLMQDLLTRGIGHEEFKEVQIGSKVLQIPSSWKIEHMRNLVTFQNGYAFKSSNYTNKGKVVLRMSNISRKGRLKFTDDNTVYCSTKEYNDLKRYHLKKGDLVICMTDMTPEKALIGRTAVIDENNKYILNQRVGRIRVSANDVLYNRHLHYYTNFTPFLNYIRTSSTRLAQSNASTKDIKNAKVYLPPLSEQKKIAEVLSTVDQKIQREQDYKEKLKKLKKGLMQDLLTGKVRVLALLSDEEKEELEKADVPG